MARVVVLIVLVCLGVFSQEASGGVFRVVACDASVGGINHSWTSSTNQPTRLTVATACPAASALTGLAAYDTLASANTPASGSAAWRFDAAPGTKISALRYARYLGKDTDDGWQVYGKTAEGLVFDSCGIPLEELTCSTGEPRPGPGSELTVENLTTSSIDFGFTCVPILGGSTCGNGGTIHQVWAILYSATVTISDPTAALVSQLTGSLLGGGYLAGAQSVTFDASDNTGIRTGRLYVDSSVVASETYSCDFTYTVPCSNKTGAQLSVDTRNLSDGTHSVQVAAVDPAGNETKSSPQTVTIDNGAPSSPLSLEVEGGSGWRSDNSFDVTWTDPGGQVAPVVVAHYEVCPVFGPNCEPERRVLLAGGSRLRGISVPGPGEWALRVWLEDSVGNADPSQAAETTLRYGSGPLDPTPLPMSDPAPTHDPATPAFEPVTQSLAPSLIPTVGAAPTRRDPLLRLTSARLSHGYVVVRGSLLRGSARRLSMTLSSAGAHPIRRAVTTSGGRFVIRIRARGVRRLRGTLVSRLAGDSTWLAATKTLRLRG